VALGSVAVAVLLGFYISARSKREMDNLVEAFGKVAAGDMNTTVMAYSEDEFAKLADSFSEMMQKLRDSQTKLATTEKIAAWQAMARKIAHEIKNPLTPIGISAEDLRRSYREKLPGFDQTLDQNTRMIKTEVDRLGKLLSEFVAFARMRAPEMRVAALEQMLGEIKTLYGEAIESGRLVIVNRSEKARVRVDADQIKQVMVNLVKNGLEAGDETTVEVTLEDTDSGIRVTVRDNGPGFSDEVLKREFEPYLSTKKDGSGLGLVICQRIVHDHGGTIAIHNRETGGAEVIIDLPQS
jgi:two-component system nitrogen regulation sensor histidine kinase NtrY